MGKYKGKYKGISTEVLEQFNDADRETALQWEGLFSAIRDGDITEDTIDDPILSKAILECAKSMYMVQALWEEYKPIADEYWRQSTEDEKV